MHHLYFEQTLSPTALASLSSRQRSERAAYQVVIRRALAERASSVVAPLRALRSAPEPTPTRVDHRPAA